MTIYGLEVILRKNCHNFEPILLHNTRVVINAMDFCGLFTNDLDSNYGGEYLALYIKIKEVLASFVQCNITPYFVFSGLVEYRGQRLKTMMRRYLPSSINRGTGGPSFQIYNVLPLACRATLTEVLRELQIPFVVVLHSSIRSAAALAALFHCPLLACASNLYVSALSSQLGSTTHIRSPPYVCLKYMDFRPVLKDPSDMSSESVLLAHAFCAEHSDLNKLTPRNRILLGLLCGTDCMPRSRLPLKVYSYLNSQSESLHPKERRYKALLRWLSEYAADSMEPVEEVIAVCPNDCRAAVTRQFAECIPSFIFDPIMDGSPLANYFGQKCMNTNTTEKQSASLGLPCSSNELFTDSQPTKRHIFDLLRGLRNECVESPDFTVGWPAGLAQVYRSGMIMNTMFCALYSKCLCLVSKNKDPNTEYSIDDCCLPIRIMHYRTILGLERHLGGCSKLIGLSPYATEYHSRGDCVVSYAIPVTPLTINFEQELTDHVLRSFLGITLPTSLPKPEWTFGLAVALAFWHQHLPVEHKMDSLENCSLVLAVAACAVAYITTQNCMNSDICDHYENVANELQSESTASDLKKSHSSDITTPHLTYQYTSIQLVYLGLRSLVNLMDSILPSTHKSNLFHFCPPWAMFPSGRLVHALTLRLQREQPSDRRRLICECWLPYIYAVRQDKIGLFGDLSTLVSIFGIVISSASSLHLSLHPTKYSIRDVHIPDVPQASQNRSSDTKLPARATVHPGSEQGCTLELLNRRTSSIVESTPQSSLLSTSYFDSLDRPSVIRRAGYIAGPCHRPYNPLRYHSSNTDVLGESRGLRSRARNPRNHRDTKGLSHSVSHLQTPV